MRKKGKKIILGAIFCTMMFASACGKDDSKKESDTKAESDILFVDSDEKPKESKEKKKEYKAKKEIKNASLYAGVIQVGDTIIEMPATCQDFINAGAAMDEDYSPDFLMDAGGSKSVWFKMNGEGILVEFINDRDDMCPLKEAQTVSIVNCLSDAVFLPGGIHIGMTMDELKEVLGEPDSDKSSDYDSLGYAYYEYPRNEGGSDCYSATGRSYFARIDRNTSRVTFLNYFWCEENDELVEQKMGENGNYIYMIPYVASRNYRHTIAVTIEEKDYMITFSKQNAHSDRYRDYSYSEEAIKANFKPDFFGTIEYDVHILKNEETEGLACGFALKDDAFVCKMVRLDRNRKYVVDSDLATLVSLSEDKTISEAAKEYFIEYMCEIAAQGKFVE